MTKKIVHCTEIMPGSAWASNTPGGRAIVKPVDHPDTERVSNANWATTSEIISFDEETGIFRDSKHSVRASMTNAEIEFGIELADLAAARQIPVDVTLGALAMAAIAISGAKTASDLAAGEDLQAAFERAISDFHAIVRERAVIISDIGLREVFNPTERE